MFRTNWLRWLLSPMLLSALAVPAWAENEGLEDLDKATQLKVTAENLEDLNDVVDRLDTALEKGLDKDNAEFAQQLLVSTLVQRGTLLATAFFNLSQQNPQRGLESMRFRQFALNDLQRAVESDPKLWDAQLLIGRLQLLSIGDPRAAKRALSVVADAEDAPSEQRAVALALRCELQKKPDERLKDITRAVELQPEEPDYLRLRAKVYFGEKKYDEALADVDQALKLEPDHARTHEIRGMILLGMERYDDALENFNRSSELAPDDALPYQLRGELYRQQGDLEKALEQLSKALELSPDNVTMLLVRAGVYYELKQTDRALADIDRAIQTQPQLLEPYRLKVEILAASDRLDEAITELERLIPQAPGQNQLVSRLGTFYVLASRPHKAIETLNKALESDPDDETAIRLRADAYLSTGKQAEAIADFERILPHTDKDANLLNNFAWVLATSPEDKLRDGPRAVKMATEACELTGYETPHILSTLAAAYAETGDFENAKKWSQKAVETSQKELDAATTDEDRQRLTADRDQLKKELASYEERKPTRERQSAEDAPPSSASTDQAVSPSVTPAQARTADF